MTPKDEDILEYLRGIYPSAEPKITIHWNMVQYFDADWHLDTTDRRIDRLSEKGFVEKIPRNGHTYYRLSDDGSGFLRGEVDAKER